MSGDGKDLHKEALRDSLLEAICGNDKYTFGYAYYFLGSWKNRTSGGVVIEDAFCYANEASVNYSLWCEEQTTAIEQADNGCKADLALKAMQSPIHIGMYAEHKLKNMFDIQLHNILQYYPKDCLLQQKPATKANSPQTIPQELNTDRAKEIFAKAVKAGYMEKTATGYKWLYNSGSKASLAYFIMQVFSPDNTKQIPFKALGQLFDVTRLDRALDQAATAKKPQQWRGAIDNLLKDL